ncbi:unnamed protein product [Agarophyton chilense]
MRHFSQTTLRHNPIPILEHCDTDTVFELRPHMWQYLEAEAPLENRSLGRMSPDDLEFAVLGGDSGTGGGMHDEGTIVWRIGTEAHSQRTFCRVKTAGG